MRLLLLTLAATAGLALAPSGPRPGDCSSGPGEFALADLVITYQRIDAAYSWSSAVELRVEGTGSGHVARSHRGSDETSESHVTLDIPREELHDLVQALYTNFFFDLGAEYLVTRGAVIDEQGRVTCFGRQGGHQEDRTITVEIGSFAQTVTFRESATIPPGLRQVWERLEAILARHPAPEQSDDK